MLACNGYQIEDLGVMVETGRIADAASKWQADVIGLSGLITPSLEEMAKVIVSVEQMGLKIPILIGGATTSDMHTAVKLAPLYSGPVIHVKDASEDVRILGELNSAHREDFLRNLRTEQQRLREEFVRKESGKTYRTLAEARARALKIDTSRIARPTRTGRFVFADYPLDEIAKLINWSYFFAGWGLAGRYPALLDDPIKGEEARKLFADAQELLQQIIDNKWLRANGVVGIYPATGDGDDIVLYADDSRRQELLRLPQLRNQQPDDETNLSLADFVAPAGSGIADYVGAFAVTAGIGLNELAERFRRDNDDYRAIMTKLLGDRLAEAFAETLHRRVRTELWGYEKPDAFTPKELFAGRYRGIRPAFGYPSCPDHSMKEDIFRLMRGTEATGIALTESYMMTPGESTCGLIFGCEEARNFSIDKIDGEQLADYAARRNVDPEKLKTIMPQHLR